MGALGEALDDLETAGVLTPGQAALLRRVTDRRLVSVYWELRVLLYLGVATLAAGLGLLVRKHFASVGHPALLGAIGLGAALCFGWCTRRGGGWDPRPLPSPDAAFDYLLLLGCLLLGTEATYLELRYRVLADHWTWWLLGSGLFYLLCAHYFDSRVVLSLALSTLGAWLGVRTSLFQAGNWAGLTRWNGIGFGAAVVGVGALLARLGWKRHFLPVHLHLGLNVLLLALVSGVDRRDGGALYLLAALAVCAASAVYAQRARRFAFLLYAVGYGYATATGFLLGRVRWGATAVALYFLLTGTAVVSALVAFHRRFRSDP